MRQYPRSGGGGASRVACVSRVVVFVVIIIDVRPPPSHTFSVRQYALVGLQFGLSAAAMMGVAVFAAR